MIIVVVSVAALFGISYRAPTIAILTETEYQSEYQTHAQQSVFQAYSVYYSTSVSEYLEKVCAEYGYPQTVVCFVHNYQAALADAVYYCEEVGFQNMASAGSCEVVDKGKVSTIFSYNAISTLTYSYTTSSTQIFTTILSTTVPFETLSTNAPPIYMSYHINQTGFTDLAFAAIIGAVGLAIIIAYPKKKGSESKNLQ
jgi:hypothetical protein